MYHSKIHGGHFLDLICAFGFSLKIKRAACLIFNGEGHRLCQEFKGMSRFKSGKKNSRRNRNNLN